MKSPTELRQLHQEDDTTWVSLIRQSFDLPLSLSKPGTYHFYAGASSVPSGHLPR